MSFQLIDDEPIDAEPVSVNDQLSYSRIDLDSPQGSQIGSMITACRQLLENWLNVGFVEREVKLQWNGTETKLPLSPNGEVSGVTEDGEELDADKYHVSAYRDKTIYIKGLYPYGTDFFYHRNGNVEINVFGAVCEGKMYEVTYTTGYETDKLPTALKEALMAQVDWCYKNIGDPDRFAICPMALTLASGYNKNTVLQ